MESAIIERRLIAVEGIVQGVGFRPYIHRLATARNLDGFVRNESGGVLIDVQGPSEVLDDFHEALTSDPPPLSMIRNIRIFAAEVNVLDGFSIVDGAGALEGPETFSKQGGFQASAPRTFVSPDVATCDDCLRELFDSSDRRYMYPFINCTHCGPRLTIIIDLPYDRPNTTMAGFPMCDRCRTEYEDPANRRFHAQPIACPGCGPIAKFQRTDGSGGSEGPGAIADTIAAICRGQIVAVKGLGGYHIACDATNARVVKDLRERKHREARPFALMVRDAAAAAELCNMTPQELALLQSRERPIVLLQRKEYSDPQLAAAMEEVAPRMTRLGVMLPYSPLHHILMEGIGRPLVMTSGNISDEPIAFEDNDAWHRLAPLADAVLSHSRPITTRCDDSVMFVVRDEPAFIRRSRGFAPRPIECAISFPRHLLAVGGQLKNTFCLARDNSAFVSHHIGDLHNSASRESLVDGIQHYSALAGVDAEVVVHDMHPDYTSTRVAADSGIARRVAVQHHHAHVASCMAEHGLTGNVIGVVFDGAGYGEDAAIWGGEFLMVGNSGFTRLGHLGYVPLPGGDAAARSPARMAISHLWSAFGKEMDSLGIEVLQRVPPAEMRIVRQMLEKQINSPATSSIGRLFDAVAAIVGLRDSAQFEGQAAMELESIAECAGNRSYPVDIHDNGSMLIADPGSIIRAVVEDVRAGASAAEVSSAFHSALASMIVDVAERVRHGTGENRIALSGGVFQNVLLVNRSVAVLERAGFDVFTQRLVPCNDGGLSLGQAYVVALSEVEV